MLWAILVIVFIIMFISPFVLIYLFKEDDDSIIIEIPFENSDLPFESSFIDSESEVLSDDFKRLEFEENSCIESCYGDVIILSKGCVASHLMANDKIIISDDCILEDGESKEYISVGENCCFNSLYSPVVEFGSDVKFDNLPNFEQNQMSSDILRDVKVVESDEVINSTIITKYDLSINNDSVIYGDISCDGDLCIGENVCIYGDIFSQKNIFIKGNVRVLGVLFAQNEIFLGQGTLIGSSSLLKSVISGDVIKVSPGCIIHGKIKAVNGVKSLKS